MDFGDGEFDRHGDIFLGDFGGGASATVRAVEVDDVGASVVTADSDHIDIVGGGDFDGDEGFGVDGENPIDMFAVVFNGVDGVEGEGGEEADPRDAFAQLGDGGGAFVTEKVAAEAGFSPLGVFKFDDGGMLDRFFTDTEHTGGNLGDDNIFILDESGRVAPFAGAGESTHFTGSDSTGDHDLFADGAVGHATTVEGEFDGVFAALAAAVEGDGKVDVGVGSGPLVLREEFKVEVVEATIRATDTVFKAVGGWFGVFGHVPSGEDEVIGPAVVAEGGWGAIF